MAQIHPNLFPSGRLNDTIAKTHMCLPAAPRAISTAPPKDLDSEWDATTKTVSIAMAGRAENMGALVAH
jgi:hypothetical protein